MEVRPSPLMVILRCRTRETRLSTRQELLGYVSLGCLCASGLLMGFVSQMYKWASSMDPLYEE